MNSEETLELERIQRGYKSTGLWDHVKMYKFCKEGYLECVRFCHENGWPWPPDATYWAVYFNKMDILDYCLAQGCSWKSDSIVCAAHAKNLDMLKYCHEHGCPLDWEATFYAIRDENIAMLEYLYEQEAPFCVLHKKQIPEASKEFLDIYGEAWKSRSFDVPLHWMKPAMH